jgi:IS4 transposase
VKSNANPDIVEELRTWRGNSISLEGKSLKAVLEDLQRQEIDVLVELEFDRTRGFSATATKQFRLGGLLNEDAEEYHLYFTNLPRSEYPAPDIAQLYRARWEVELLFKELKSRLRLDEINTTKPYIIEALIIMAAISLMISREIIDELHELEAKRGDTADADESASRLPPRRGSLVVERHTHLIHLYLMLELGYELPDLDELLLWASQDPNPHRERLRSDVESGEFAFDRH